MRKLLLVFFLTATIFSCRKYTFDDGLPKVKITAVEINEYENVVLKGDVTFKGDLKLEHTGFCYSDHPNTKMEENQIVFEDGKTSFSATLELAPGKYYFRCFAVNEIGYTLSDEVEFTVTKQSPSVAPCVFNYDNYIIVNDKPYSLSSIQSGPGKAIYGGYGIQLQPLNSSAPQIWLDFHKRPVNGKYATVNDPELFKQRKHPREVYAKANVNVFSPGDSVYIYELTSGVVHITFCDLKYTLSGQQHIVKAKFNCCK